ncbi:RsmE family RNA methyltransferase [Candidatus Wolfebacteria bacterium]|nr:RsmE family RNA methyltransferase [Candidatus Wolfebacteria bacterium]
MKIHRFIVNFDLNPKKTGGVSDFLKIEDKEIINQIKNVLRLKTGENIILSDGKSNEILGEIQEIKSAPGEGLKIKIINIYENKNEPAIRGILYCALLKKENFELAVQKSVEAGIKEIIPVKTERTVKFNLKKDRVLKIMKEASEQSERGIIPELMEILDFKKASEEAAKNDFNFLFDKSGEPIQKIISRVAVSLNKKTSLLCAPRLRRLSLLI